MGHDRQGRGRVVSARASVGDWSRRQYLTAASTSAVLGSVGLAGCLGGARDENTIVMSGDTDFEGAMDGEDAETSIQEALWDAGLDESITVDVQPASMTPTSACKTTSRRSRPGAPRPISS